VDLQPTQSSTGARVIDFIGEILRTDQHAPREQRHAAHRIFDADSAGAAEATVAESSVRRYVGRRQRGLGLMMRETFVPQVDA
jgi:chorismate-pyruvate lyase